MDRIDRLAGILQNAVPRMSLVEAKEGIEAIRHHLRTNPEDGPWSIMYASEAYREFAEKRVGSRVMGFNHGMPTLVIKDPMPVTESEEDWMSLDGLEVVEYTYTSTGITTSNGTPLADEDEEDDDPFVPIEQQRRSRMQDRIVIRSDVLRVTRTNLRLSQMDLARRTGLAQTKISALERGVTTVQPDLVPKLAKALNVDPDDLLLKDHSVQPEDLVVDVPPLPKARKAYGPRTERVPLRPGAVREARQELNLTQTELARQAGMSSGTIWLIEKHNATVNRVQLERLSDVLCVMPDELLDTAQDSREPDFAEDEAPVHMDLIPVAEMQPKKRRIFGWIKP